MNEFRSALQKGEVNQVVRSPAKKENCRRRVADTSLSKILIPRGERRTTNQRREDRFRGVVDRATVTFRRKKVLAKVVNLSGSGIMLEAPLEPRIGEKLRVEFDGFESLYGQVCWVRDGRCGIDLGDGAIKLD
jgi:hypothetical protein